MEIVIEQTWDGAPARPGEVVRLDLRLGDALEIAVDAPWHGDPAPPGRPGPTDGLWDYEVVEVFVAGTPRPGEPVPYTEIEVGPHGHHLVLQLVGVRNAVARALPLQWSPTRDGDRWTGVARLHRSLLPAAPTTLNAYAIHGIGRQRRHLAWRPVPGAQPDFHRLDAFAPWPTSGST